MSDLISRDALLEHIDRRIRCIDIAPDPLYRIAWEIVRDWIAYDAPIVNDVPVVHGRWVKVEGFWCCSNCGCSPADWDKKPYNPYGLPPYCHGCGAKMDGGAEK